MLRRKKLSVVLCQLGVQYSQYANGQPQLNIPLALGYLVSGLEVTGLLEKCHVEVLDLFHSLYASDSAVVNRILKPEPDVVGFSCYSWNIGRTLSMASKIAAKRPDIFIVLGGPEATEQSENILEKHAPISAIIRGEGEEAFAKLISGLLKNDLSTKIPGLSIRLKNTIHHASVLAMVSDITKFPSPYERGYLKITDYGSLNIETVRGCIFHCDYCYYPKQFRHIRAFPLERIISEVRYAIKAGISHGYLMDPVFNMPDRVEPLCEAIASENTNRQIIFQTEARAELIDEKVAALFQKANIRHVELGLQSTNPKALRQINRSFIPGSFTRAVELLQDAGIHIRVGIIIGLPKDRLVDVEHTLDYVISLGVGDIQCFLLQVLPGTPLWRKAESLGIEHQKFPPYYIKRNRELSEEEILLAYSHAVERIRLLNNRQRQSPDLSLTGFQE